MQKNNIKEDNYNFKKNEILNKYIITYSIDLQGNIIDVSEAFCNILAYSKDELLGKSQNILLHQDVKKSFYENINNILKNDNTWEAEVKYLNKKNEEYLFNTIVSAIFNDNKEKIAYINICTPITKRKEIDDKLKQALHIFENTHDGIVITDENVNITNVNKSFQRVTGYSLEEVKGLNPKILKSLVHDNSFYQDMWFSLNENGFWIGEITNKKKNGKLYEELLTITALYDENKKICNYMGIFTDITKQKKQERLLLQQARNSAIGEMIENITHQWRQPLSTISTIATALKFRINFNQDKEIDNNELANAFTSINKNTQYLSKTIDDFRTFFKGDLEKIKSFALQDSLKKLNDLTKDSFSNKFIKIVADIQSDNIFIKGNENLLIQSLINIYNNAKDVLEDKINKTENNRYFFITLKKIENEAVIYLKDNAGGIKEENIQKIFDPYFTTKHQSQGTGLGLYMTYEIITKQLKGKIEVINEEFIYNNIKHIGARFKISLYID